VTPSPRGQDWFLDTVVVQRVVPSPGKNHSHHPKASKANPALFIAQYLYKHRPLINPPTSNPDHNHITLVCISDIHSTTPDVPNGDILLHAGDLTKVHSKSFRRSSHGYPTAQA
jgi:hypothetical protein